MIERGERVAHLDTLASLSRALGVGLGSLLEGADPEEKETSRPVWQPLVDFARARKMSPHDVTRLLNTARNLFPEA